MSQIVLLNYRVLLRGVVAGLLLLSCYATSAVLSKQQIATLVVQQYQAKVLSIRQVSQGGQQIYIVKLLTASGRVKVLKIDANTGAVLNGN